MILASLVLDVLADGSIVALCSFGYCSWMLLPWQFSLSMITLMIRLMSFMLCSSVAHSFLFLPTMLFHCERIVVGVCLMWELDFDWILENANYKYLERARCNISQKENFLFTLGKLRKQLLPFIWEVSRWWVPMGALFVARLWH